MFIRQAAILGSLVLALACSPQGTRNVNSTGTNSPEESRPVEATQPEDDAEDTGTTDDAVTEESSPTPTETTTAEDPPPTTPKKRRYRRGGSKIRKGDRGIELAKAVDSRGKRVTLESHKAPVLVLTFGASWCAPCKKELPALEKLAKAYARDKVDFVAVNIDSSVAKGKTFMQRSGLKRVQAVYDPKSISVRSYAPPTMPSVFIMNEGIVKHVHAGFRSGDEAKLKKAINRELR